MVTTSTITTTIKSTTNTIKSSSTTTTTQQKQEHYEGSARISAISKIEDSGIGSCQMEGTGLGGALVVVGLGGTLVVVHRCIIPHTLAAK